MNRMGKDHSVKPMRGQTVFLLAAAVHFATTRIVSALTLTVVNNASFAEAEGAIPEVLGMLSKVLYFPVVSLALYPRGLFPGNWILVPIAANSLLWGLALWGLWRLLRR